MHFRNLKYILNTFLDSFSDEYFWYKCSKNSFLSFSESTSVYTWLKMIVRKMKSVNSRCWKFVILLLVSTWVLYFITKLQIEYFEDSYYDFNEIPIQIVSATIPIEESIENYDSAEMEFLNYKLDYHVKRFPVDCNNKTYLIMIPSRPAAYHERMAIRNSWLQNKARYIVFICFENV